VTFCEHGELQKELELDPSVSSGHLDVIDTPPMLLEKIEEDGEEQD